MNVKRVYDFGNKRAKRSHSQRETSVINVTILATSFTVGFVLTLWT